MTDEEKEKTEKEYKEWLVHDHKLLKHPTYCDIEQKCFRAFFAGTRYGLVEGRKELEVTNKENERIRRTMLTYSECITEHQNTIKRKDEENAELKAQNKSTRMDNGILVAKLKTYEALWDKQQIVIKEKSAQIEKMKSFIHSEIDFCVYCPLTNECKNDEGTCPYAYAPEEEQKNLLMDFIQKWELAE